MQYGQHEMRRGANGASLYAGGLAARCARAMPSTRRYALCFNVGSSMAVFIGRYRRMRWCSQTLRAAWRRAQKIDTGHGQRSGRTLRGRAASPGVHAVPSCRPRVRMRRPSLMLARACARYAALSRKCSSPRSIVLNRYAYGSSTSVNQRRRSKVAVARSRQRYVVTGVGSRRTACAGRQYTRHGV